ncbi:hypothetical protein EK21DRAFT_101591 [Setomelanomma holmii]|uniref:Uncharacterized protein n=1 Tax=Setomelanomma holmii TaxID=210430 RepID=A0A9P4LKY9_9PLEO|nr:hypothetical protein EK21DRAFT_101591 [Setomelanomma holmii]
MDEAIAAMKSHKPGERLWYPECAKKSNVPQTTLMQRCKGTQKSMAARKIEKQKLNLHQEAELVTRFISQNNDHLILRWTKGIDAARHYADSEAKYDLYFDLLYEKIKEYDVEPAYTYNIDEKGFAIRESEDVTQFFQDGSREWITVLAGVCADGSTLPPGLIYASKNCSVRSTWVEDIKAGKHEVLVTSTPSG